MNIYQNHVPDVCGNRVEVTPFSRDIDGGCGVQQAVHSTIQQVIRNFWENMPAGSYSLSGEGADKNGIAFTESASTSKFRSDLFSVAAPQQIGALINC